MRGSVVLRHAHGSDFSEKMSFLIDTIPDNDTLSSLNRKGEIIGLFATKTWRYDELENISKEAV